jgi:hypothetical protein
MQSSRSHEDFYPEDGGSKVLQNTGNNLSDYMAKHFRRQEYFSVFSNGVKKRTGKNILKVGSVGMLPRHK